MSYRVEGIIIRSMDYGEGNKIVTVLTNTSGKVGVFVRGAKKTKSRFSLATQLFVYGEYGLYQGSGLATLQHGEVIESHRVLREQLYLTACASYLSELTDKTLEPDQAGNYIFEQLLASFSAFIEGKDPQIIMHIYEMKILQSTGYHPELAACVACGLQENLIEFSVSLGGMLCSKCHMLDPYALRIMPKTIKLLRLFTMMDLRRLGNIDVQSETKNQLKRCMRAFIDKHLDISFKSRQFLDQLQNGTIENL